MGLETKWSVFVAKDVPRCSFGVVGFCVNVTVMWDETPRHCVHHAWRPHHTPYTTLPNTFTYHKQCIDVDLPSNDLTDLSCVICSCVHLICKFNIVPTVFSYWLYLIILRYRTKDTGMQIDRKSRGEENESNSKISPNPNQYFHFNAKLQQYCILQNEK